MSSQSESTVLFEKPRLVDTSKPFLKREISKVPSLSIAYRIAASFAVLIVIGMGVLSLFILSNQTDLMRKQISSQGQTLVNQFAHSATEPLFTDDLFSLEVMVNQLTTDSLIVNAIIFDENKNKVISGGTNQFIPVEKFSRESQFQSGEGVFWNGIDDSKEQNLVAFVSPISFQGVVAGYASITLKADTLRSAHQQTMKVLFAVILAMMVVALSIAYWMSRQLAKPVTTLVNATQSLAKGEFNVHIDWHRRDELGQLAKALNNMSRSLHEKQQMEGVLSRFVADDVAKNLLNDLDKVDIGCEKVDASVLFVDIVGYSELAEKTNTETVVALLNEYLAYFTLCSQLFHGTVDKFIGDCAMVIFGAPRLNQDHRFNAIACATVMVRLLDQVNAIRCEEGKQKIDVRIGINSGEMMAGYVGAHQRMEYTVVGDAVNIASRLSRLADPGQIIVGEEVVQHESLKDRVVFTSHNQVTVKGRKGVTNTFLIESIDPQWLRTMDTMIQDVLQRSKSKRATEQNVQKVAS